MVDVSDSKSDGGDTVWVQVPPQAPLKNTIELWFKLLININSKNGIDFFVIKKDMFNFLKIIIVHKKVILYI